MEDPPDLPVTESTGRDPSPATEDPGKRLARDLLEKDIPFEFNKDEMGRTKVHTGRRFKISSQSKFNLVSYTQ